METQNQTHPSAVQLAAFALGKLPEEASSRLKEHLSICPNCATIVSNTPRDTFVDILQKAVASRKMRDQSTPGIRDSSTLSGIPQGKAGAPPSPPKPRPPQNSLAAGMSQMGDLESEAVTDESIPEALRHQTKYRVIRLLGQGGMGSVYEAKQEMLDRQVAIKIMNASIVDHPEALQRFKQEMKVVAKLDHPNVTCAYDADQIGSLHIFVMQFIPGRSLDKVLAKRGPFSVTDACRIIRQAADGLQHAYEQGIVHRDLKPQNLMLTPDGKLKILDFGLGKLASERKAAELTGEDKTMGTYQYISPEQARDAKSADIRADIYSLGCTLYCLLTGSPPFGGNATELLLAHLNQAPPKLSDVRPDIPEGLSAFVDTMLAKDPSDRPQTPAEVAKGLAPFARGNVATPSAPSPQEQSFLDFVNEEEKNPSKVSMRVPPQGNNNRNWLISAGGGGAFLALVLALGAAGVFKIRSSEGTIVLENVPADVEVLVDGTKVTLTPNADDVLTIEHLPEGKHQLKIVQDNKPLWSDDVSIVIGGQKVRARYERVVTGSFTPLPSTSLAKVPRRELQTDIGQTLPAFTNSIGMELVQIPAGEFLMGSPDSDGDASPDEKPQHLVRITKQFYMGRTEVTQSQWETVMRNTPWREKENVYEGGDYPATYVSWDDAQEFCRRLSEKEGRRYRLPTEAEWEYTCRAGSRTLYSYGDSKDVLGAYAWFDKNTKDVREKYPHTVGTKRANPWGLYDVHGNVDEWCQDWRGTYSADSLDDPQGPEIGTDRVCRGGNWYHFPQRCRSAFRLWHFPSEQHNDLGFRVVLDLMDQSTKSDAYTEQSGSNQTTAGNSTPEKIDVTHQEVVPTQTQELTTNAFTSLFNGKDLIGWKTQIEGSTTWSVIDGALVGSGQGTDTLLLNRPLPENIHIRVEASINRHGNGGIFLRLQEGDPGKAYEAQINCDQNFPVNTGSIQLWKNSQTTNPDVLVRAPKHMSITPDEWFVMDIIVEGNHIKTAINGTSCAEYTDKDSQYLKGGLGLQKFTADTLVKFRKIEFMEISKSGATPSVRKPKNKEKQPKYTSLFNGKDLTGWKTHPVQPGDWSVNENGILVGRGALSHLYTERDDFENVHIRARVRINGGNGGILARTGFGPDRGRYLAGVEAQIDGGKDVIKSGGIFVTNTSGTYDKVQSTVGSMKPWEWFTEDLIVEGDQVIVMINGEETARYTGARAAKGHIALQCHDPNTVVEFQSIEVLEIGKPESDPIAEKLSKAEEAFEESRKTNRSKNKLKKVYIDAITDYQKSGQEEKSADLQQRLDELNNPADIPSDAKQLGQKFYKYFPEQMSWHGAKTKCEAMGGHLAIIDNEQEDAFITNLVKSANGGYAWLGATDEVTEGEWKWIDGRKMTYKNWDTDPKHGIQPNNKRGEEHYLVKCSSFNGVWADQPSNSTQHKPGFVCQWVSANGNKERK